MGSRDRIFQGARKPDFHQTKKTRDLGWICFFFEKRRNIYIYINIYTYYMYMNIQTYRNIYIYLFIWKGRERNICIYTYIIFIYLYNYSISTHVKPSNFGGIAPWSRKNALESYSLNCSWVHWLYILLVYEGVRLYIYIFMHGTFEKRSKPFWHSILQVVWYGFLLYMASTNHQKITG